MSLDFFPCKIPIPYDASYIYDACNVLVKSYSKSLVATMHVIVLVKSTTGPKLGLQLIIWNLQINMQRALKKSLGEYQEIIRIFVFDFSPVRVRMFEGEECKKTDMSVLEISCAINNKVHSLHGSADYLILGVVLCVILASIPILYR